MLVRVLGVLFVALLASTLPPRIARACATVFPPEGKAPPRIEQERTLIVWDASTRRQHFVREVRFTNTGELPFGFIVPTPSRPEVADVPAPPFDRLEEAFPHTLLETPEPPPPTFAPEGGGQAVAAAAGPPPVQVLEKKRVGDFTSFVLAASDANALTVWLNDNKFRATPAGQRWAERYVKLGFFFVALRYEPKKPKPGETEGLISRSVRFSFDSALPYYPYEEPSDAPEQRGRELLVWLITQGLHLPLAPVVDGEAVALWRPWSEGVRYEGHESLIRATLGADLAALVPAGARVMTFGDWKESRRGFGDLVLAPARPEGCDVACASARRPLMALLDPTLGEGVADPAQLVVPPPVLPAAHPATARTPTATGASSAHTLIASCGLARPGSSAGAGLLAGLGFLLARRARRRAARVGALGAALLALVACRTSHRPTPVARGEPGLGLGPGGLETFALPPGGIERQRAVMRLLAGHHDDKIIPVWSTPSGGGIGPAKTFPTRAVTDPGRIQRICAADPRVEGSVTYVVDSDESGAARAHVEGPFPTALLACVESLLVSSGTRVSPGVDRGVISLGPLTPEVIALRRRIKAAKGFRPVPG